MTTSLGRDPLEHYGSLQPTIEQLHAHRPLDLSARRWRQAHPDAPFTAWRDAARACLRDGLHYDPGPLDLQPEVIEVQEHAAFTRERIAFNTAPWFRVPGYFYLPRNAPRPLPALVLMHEWGGPMLFGAERVCGEPVHEVIAEHRQRVTSGRAIADWFASHGYAVLVIDAYHFGHRAPRGVNGLPERYDPAALDRATLEDYEAKARDLLYLGVRQLNWAGTTWAGLNTADDRRSIDYLLSRPEVDPRRIGVTGLSGGGWRTNLLAALDDRVTAAVPVGWMTTGDTQACYNVAGAIGTFCLLPGVWGRLDVPDLIAMAAPAACMVVSGTQDPLFPPRGQDDAADQIADAYAWAGVPERFRSHRPDVEHCYDADIQAEALAWFDRHLKG